MPEMVRSTRGPVDGLELDGDRRGPRRSDGKLPSDAATAPWFDAAVSCWGKAVAYADEVGLDLSLFGKMRAGAKPVYLRHLLPILGKVEPVLAFVGPLLDSIGYVAVPKRGPTAAEVKALGHDSMWDTLMYREHVYRLGERRGWTRDQIEAALRGEHHPEEP
jgi:hypothetical protein